MPDKDTMRRVDMKKEIGNYSEIHQHYIKKAENIRQSVGTAQRAMNKRMYMTAGACVLLAGSIYTYTIRSIKQERFLDEYDDMHKK